MKMQRGPALHGDERGFTWFEIAVTILILLFIGASCYAAMIKIRDNDAKNKAKLNQFNSQLTN